MKMNRKGFTLIELLVVVAIIGILAAVGIPMYQGYQATAKFNAVKATHKQVVTFISSEVTKCGIGKNLDLKGANGERAPNAIDCKIISNRSGDKLAQKFVDHFEGDQWMNPMNTTDLQVYLETNEPNIEEAGRIHVIGAGSQIYVRTLALDPDVEDIYSDEAMVKFKHVIRIE